MVEVPKEGPAVIAALIKQGRQQLPAGEQQGFRTFVERTVTQSRFQRFDRRLPPQRGFVAFNDRGNDSYQNIVVSGEAATGGTTEGHPMQKASDTLASESGSDRGLQEQQRDRHSEGDGKPNGLAVHTKKEVPLPDMHDGGREAYQHSVYAGMHEGPLTELEEARRERFERGDLIGQLRDFFETSGMEDGARRYLRIPGGIQILVDYNKNFRGKSFLQIRNVDGIDTFKMGANGLPQPVNLPLDQWEAFMHAVTEPGFEDGARFYSGILVSGEADTRISEWCETNRWERVRPREGFSKTTPDSYLFILPHQNDQ